MLSAKHNHSPWLHDLRRARPAMSIDRNLATEVVIIGGGIAGIATAFFLLENTDKEVALIEAHKVAHGATGHNAGQIASYFERPFRELVSEFGLEMAARGEQDIRDSWSLLEEMYETADASTPFASFDGYAGCKSLDHLFANLLNNRHRAEAGIPLEQIFVAQDLELQGLEEFAGLYALAPQSDILRKLETKDLGYIAALSSRKGCVNSARFCEEVLSYLLDMYPDRFEVMEHTPVKELRLKRGLAEMDAGEFSVSAHRVVLCTNGFEYITIKNEHGGHIDDWFHQLVRGSIGYMVGFTERSARKPAAISYLVDKARHTDAFSSAPYYYMTRRKHHVADRSGINLVCLGGPESLVEDTTSYRKDHSYPARAEKQFDDFFAQVQTKGKKKPEYEYRWHGLMGYTPSGVRCIGPEPCNPVLLYNLGCNGVGILSSVYGGHRIARYMKGEEMEPSIFDPRKRPFRSPFLSAEQWLIVLGALTVSLCAVILGSL